MKPALETPSIDEQIRQLTRDNKALTLALERVVRDGVLPELAKLMLTTNEPWTH